MLSTWEDLPSVFSWLLLQGKPSFCRHERRAECVAVARRTQCLRGNGQQNEDPVTAVRRGRHCLMAGRSQPDAEEGVWAGAAGGPGETCAVYPGQTGIPPREGARTDGRGNWVWGERPGEGVGSHRGGEQEEQNGGSAASVDVWRRRKQQQHARRRPTGHVNAKGNVNENGQAPSALVPRFSSLLR